MSYTKGKPLCPEEKKLLISVKHYFDRNKSDFGSNAVMFQKCFLKKILPNIPDKSIIVMDNASYHKE